MSKGLLDGIVVLDLTRVLAGLSLAIGVLAALTNKQRTGEGEKVDIALVDSVVSAMMNINMIYFTEGRIPQRIGNRYESTYPYDSFKTSDGDVIIGAGNDKLFALLCTEMQQEELLADERFITVSDRVANHIPLKEIKGHDLYGLCAAISLPGAKPEKAGAVYPNAEAEYQWRDLRFLWRPNVCQRELPGQPDTAGCCSHTTELFE